MRFAENLVELAIKKNFQNKEKFVKEAFILNPYADQLEMNDERLKNWLEKSKRRTWVFIFSLMIELKLKRAE